MTATHPFSFSLSLDLSAPRGTLAIHQMDSNETMRCLHSAVITQDGNHSENLIPRLQEALLQTGIGLSQIDRFITTTGPGSFTGLRVGLASVKALAYSQAKPIETMSGSEARAFSWIEDQRKLGTTDFSSDQNEEILVLTYLTSDRFVCSHFNSSHTDVWSMASETVSSNFQFLDENRIQILLMDDRISVDVVPKNKTNRVLRYPLEARYLAETISKSMSRKISSTLPEWINLVPNYFGSSRY